MIAIIQLIVLVIAVLVLVVILKFNVQIISHVILLRNGIVRNDLADFAVPYVRNIMYYVTDLIEKVSLTEPNSKFYLYNTTYNYKNYPVKSFLLDDGTIVKFAQIDLKDKPNIYIYLFEQYPFTTSKAFYPFFRYLALDEFMMDDDGYFVSYIKEN